MNKYITELVGTFFLVFTIGCTVIGTGAGALAPLAIGSALMVMIFAGGHISGGHYNPAVTLGVWMRGKCETKDVVPYMLFQVVGAALAALAVGVSSAGVRQENQATPTTSSTAHPIPTIFKTRLLPSWAKPSPGSSVIVRGAAAGLAGRTNSGTALLTGGLGAGGLGAGV